MWRYAHGACFWTWESAQGPWTVFQCVHRQKPYTSVILILSNEKGHNTFANHPNNPVSSKMRPNRSSAYTYQLATSSTRLWQPATPPIATLPALICFRSNHSINTYKPGQILGETSLVFNPIEYRTRLWPWLPWWPFITSETCLTTSHVSLSKPEHVYSRNRGLGTNKYDQRQGWGEWFWGDTVLQKSGNQIMEFLWVVGPTPQRGSP